jgi:hypothetical protein
VPKTSSQANREFMWADSAHKEPLWLLPGNGLQAADAMKERGLRSW